MGTYESIQYTKAFYLYDEEAAMRSGVSLRGITTSPHCASILMGDNFPIIPSGGFYSMPVQCGGGMRLVGVASVKKTEDVAATLIGSKRTIHGGGGKRMSPREQRLQEYGGIINAGCGLSVWGPSKSGSRIRNRAALLAARVNAHVFNNPDGYQLKTLKRMPVPVYMTGAIHPMPLCKYSRTIKGWETWRKAKGFTPDKPAGSRAKYYWEAANRVGRNWCRSATITFGEDAVDLYFSTGGDSARPVGYTKDSWFDHDDALETTLTWLRRGPRTEKATILYITAPVRRGFREMAESLYRIGNYILPRDVPGCTQIEYVQGSNPTHAYHTIVALGLVFPEGTRALWEGK